MYTRHLKGTRVKFVRSLIELTVRPLFIRLIDRRIRLETMNKKVSLAGLNVFVNGVSKPLVMLVPIDTR